MVRPNSCPASIAILQRRVDFIDLLVARNGMCSRNKPPVMIGGYFQPKGICAKCQHFFSLVIAKAAEDIASAVKEHTTSGSIAQIRCRGTHAICGVHQPQVNLTGALPRFICQVIWTTREYDVINAPSRKQPVKPNLIL